MNNESSGCKMAVWPSVFSPPLKSSAWSAIGSSCLGLRLVHPVSQLSDPLLERRHEGGPGSLLGSVELIDRERHVLMPVGLEPTYTQRLFVTNRIHTGIVRIEKDLI